MESLITVIKNYAFIHPDRLAIVDDKKEVTYEELNQRVNQWCGFLLEKGVTSNQSVMVFMHNKVEYLEVILALVKINAKVIPLNVYYKQSEIEYLIVQNQDAMMIADKEFSHLIEKASRNKSNIVLYVEDVGEKLCGTYPNSAIPEKEFNSPLIFFTSGTTGKPKGIVLYPDSFFLQVPTDYYQETTECHLITRGLFFRSHLTLAISVLQEGKTLVLMREKSNESIWLLAHKYSINHMVSGPSDLTSLVEWLQENGKVMPESLEVVMTTGSLISYTLKRELTLHLPNTSFIDFYGTSEVGGISSIDETEWMTKHGSVGIPSFFVNCRITDEKGEKVKTGEIGEICISSSYTMKEYLENEELNKNTFFQNFVRTGDYGYLDEDGYLFLSGRRQDEINHGGFSFYSTEVEDFLNRLSSVKDAIVLGKKNDAYGQIPIAYLVIDKQSNKYEVEEEIRKVCEDRLPAFKKPVFFHFLSEMPLTSAGKPNREKLLSLRDH